MMGLLSHLHFLSSDSALIQNQLTSYAEVIYGTGYAELKQGSLIFGYLTEYLRGIFRHTEKV